MKEILDHGYLNCIEWWGSDERIIEAARMSTNKGFEGWAPKHKSSCATNFVAPGTNCATCDCGILTSDNPELTHPGDEKLLAYLYNNRHSTPFEMAGLIVEVKAPIFVFREWHRHRTQSYNEMSARYIPLPNEDYMPTVERVMLAQQGTQNKQAQSVGSDFTMTEATVAHDQQQLWELYEQMEKTYQYLLQRGWPKELARCATGVARYSRMRASANLRNWLAFLTLRMDARAQWEIRQYANAVGELIAYHFPRTWHLFMLGGSL